MPDPTQSLAIQTPAPSSTQPSAAPPVSMRKFGDHLAVRRGVFDNALAAATNIPAVENSRYRLGVTDVGYNRRPDYSLAEQREALLDRRSLAHHLVGTVTLTDKASGTPVDTRRMTLAAVPYLSNQGYFIVDGNPTVVSHQLRLVPGVYTRKSQAGLVEAHVNQLPGEGVSHRVHLDPDSGVFKVAVGQAEIPALALLRALGASDDEVHTALGGDGQARDLLARNDKATKGHHLDRLYEKFGPAGPIPEDPEKKAEVIRTRLGSFRLDPWVTARTLGAPHRVYDKAAALATVKKILTVYRGEAEPDDRDHPAYSVVMGPEHLVAERIARSKPVLTKLLWNATNTGKLDRLPPGFLTKSIKDLFLRSGLGNNPEGSSAAEFMDHGARITKVGEGGIGRSSDSVPMSARYVSSGQIPFIDLIRTSECFDPETEVMTYDGWKRWPEVVPTDRFACLVDGRLEFHHPERLYVHDYAGEMYGARSAHIDYLVTPTHRFWVRPLGMTTWRWRTAEETHGRGVHHQSAGHTPWAGDGGASFIPPPVVAEVAVVDAAESVGSSRRKLGGSRLQTRAAYPIEPFAELLGWYLGEGSTRIRTGRGRNNAHAVVISQSMTANPAKCARIAACIAELGLKGRYYRGAGGFIIANKQLAHYFRQFGYSDTRWIPREFLSAPEPARRRLFEALLLAEGTKRKSGTGYGTFSSSSRRLADDFALLAFSLGYSTATSTYQDTREARYLPMHLVTIHSRTVRQVRKAYVHTYRGARPDEYYTTRYSGPVYCATVPGGKLYVRRNGSCGFWSGNSESVGVDLRTAFGTRLGSDKNIYAPVRTRSGRIAYKTPRDLADAVVAFPNAEHSTDPLVPAIKYGKHAYVPKGDVDYVIPSMEQTFSPLTNLVTMKSASKPHRASMGARMISQSLPLVDPEAPLVRSGIPDQPGKSFVELFGRHMGASFARDDAGGVVTGVTPEAIKVRYDDGAEHSHDLFNHYPAGRKSSYQSYPQVTPGQRVGPGQILATSNYTDSKGHAAYGKNARVMLAPFKGLAYEDSQVISESFAKKLTSHHLYRHDVEPDDATTLGRTAHAATFPGKYPLAVMKTIDDEGVVKKGTVVNPGDPLVLAIRKREGDYGRLSRSAKAGYADASETWDHDEPGKVVDVRMTKNGPVVLVETFTPAKPGDKLAGTHGNKGVVNVVPDHQMPVSEDGRPVDAVISSLGTISRINESAVFEAALGKIAAKTGVPYVVHDFQHNRSVGKFVEDELARHGVKFTETVTDPTTGRKIPNVGVGNLYLMKLVHMAAPKAKGRGLGGYDESGQPTRGAEGGAMRSSLGDSSALISYGASHNLRDAHLARGQANPEFWTAYMAGFPVKHDHTSSAFERFATELKAAGVHPVRDGDRYHLMGLKKSTVRDMTGDREVHNGETLDFSRDNRPYPGGLMDEKTFGAVDAKDTWGKVTLHEPVVNPVFEEPARRLLGLTEKQFRDTIAGNHALPGGGTGMRAVIQALEAYDVPKELETARRRAADTRKTVRDDANRKVGILKYLDRNKTAPADWVWDAVPVLPPAYRPVTPGRAGGNAVTADPNLVYKDLIEANKAYKALHGKVEDVGAERLNLYDAVKAVAGLGEPVSAKNRERGVRGILGKLLGDTAKHSFVQQKLLGTPVDLSGRGQVLPSPDLDLDEMGLPESIAWDVFHPFVVRRLVRAGVPRVEAAKAAADRAPMARKALVEEMGARPVLATRYPVLHRYGVMAFRPKLVPGSAILSNNLINKPYNLDHDGDTFTVNVPLTDAAVKEAYEKLLPSQNLFSPATMKATNFVPNMEYTAGLNALTNVDEKNEPVTFKTLADARQAYERGEINYGTRVRILE